MRVYELMEILSNCSAGAEVKFSTLKTLKEIAECSEVDLDGVVGYDISEPIREVVTDNDAIIMLHS